MDDQQKNRMKPPKRPQPAITDDRFAHALNDPIFRRVPRKEKRVDIDKRFQSMFHDKQFKLKYSVDKRGRPIDLSTDEDLRQYYNLVAEDEDDAEDDGVQASADDVNITQKQEIHNEVGDSGSESEVDAKFIEGNISESEIRKRDLTTKLTSTIKKKLRDNNTDYARGDGFLFEDSSDDSSSSADENDDADDTIHAWGELDRDAERTEESSSRLALCNIDWDRLKAVDLMVLFHSFLPSGGVLKSVNIYTSEYGKQRLADEEVHGPMELRRTDSDSEDALSDDEVGINGGKEEDEEGGDYQMEKLRKYQLNRLKYFYAVLEFDSIGTAEKIYAECDGMEYESSATRVDLRYIPEEMVFEDEPNDSCDNLPQADKYRPRFFTTTALQQAKVRLTWDETDPLRRELTQKVHNPKEKIDDEDLRAYLASSDSEDEINGDAANDGSDTESNVDPVAKYRALLESLETKEKKKDNDVEMEITWGVGLKERTESLVKKKLEEQTASTLTPWEEILDKKKVKKKQKKTQQKLQRKESPEDPESEAEDEAFSDDEVDVDMEDSFFRDEIESNEIMKGNSEKKKRSTVGSRKEKKTSEADNNASLELLLMDDSDNKQHFSLKKIMEAESESKGKKKRKNRKAKETGNETGASQIVDDFQVNVADSRFGALFSSHLYNVDPSDPNFKKTKGMTAIIQEKQKRRADEGQEEGSKPNTGIGNDPPNPKIPKNELSYLVKSVKRNAQILKTRGNKRK